jgi:malate/lactate dehydrogenase
MALISSGQYGVPKGLCFSYPVTCENGWYHIVKGLTFDEFG